MSKERLEELNEKLRKCRLNRGIGIFSINDIDWVLRQAECVQELEEDIEHYKEAIKNRKEDFEECEAIASQVYGLDEQNKRYRKAIKETLQAMGMVDLLKYGETLERALEESE